MSFSIPFPPTPSSSIPIPFPLPDLARFLLPFPSDSHWLFPFPPAPIPVLLVIFLGGKWEMWGFHWLPFPSSHSYFRSNETSLAIPIPMGPAGPIEIDNIDSSIMQGRNWSVMHSAVLSCYHCLNVTDLLTIRP